MLNVSLEDKFDISKHQVLLNGTQALVRLMIAQKERDTFIGWDTAGYVTGYRGSPLGAVDFQMRRAKCALMAASVTFQEGLNEDLAATALWGTQQAELRGEGKYDGVFGLWYGKGPGVDRSGDAMRHANMAGSSAKGGVIMAMGDDHTGESSTTLHQSDLAMVDAQMPIVSPAGVQEILDFGHYGFELSRFSGLWVGLKTMKDTIEVTSVVDADPHRLTFVRPDITLPEDGLNIRLVDTATLQETRLLDYKVSAAEAFARANRMDKRVLGQKGAKIGFVAAGKNWLDLAHALSLLNIDGEQAKHLGVTTYKVAQTWPLDRQTFSEWAEGLDLIVVVEEKRKLIESQVKDALFDNLQGRRVYGGLKGSSGEILFPSKGALDPNLIAEMLGHILVEEGCSNALIEGGILDIAKARRADNASDIASRIPYFCAGCPHNSSTKVPDGSRAYAGIGCHFMAQWMDRETLGYTHMGGEGANWIGEAKFSKRDHVFQNLGDGTYNHSGIQAIRAALAAGTNITYKILFNDAVAMTGGQGNEGGLSALRITRELLAMGVENLALVYDDKEDLDLQAFPKNIIKHEREDLMDVQESYSKIKGVSCIVYVQTCAAEKRRRRKRDQFPDPDQRIFINTDVCEGCGDCGVQSNCVALTPVETEFGRKRAIDQSACNKDFSCVKGFCPSFVSLHGATPKKRLVR
ncbi:MAG: indolepyruvate ferredoxin oxidoreductase family protein, partial [Paracoccaceae bacterium]|nr:indolepyruvate ferredoxin oxidoreductase family protein [Paracoccaceae bacterium]